MHGSSGFLISKVKTTRRHPRGGGVEVVASRPEHLAGSVNRDSGFDSGFEPRSHERWS